MRKPSVLTLIAAAACIVLIALRTTRPPSPTAVISATGAPVLPPYLPVTKGLADAASAQLESSALEPPIVAEPLPNPEAEVAAGVLDDEEVDAPAEPAEPINEVEDIEEDSFADNETITGIPDDAGLHTSSEALLTTSVDDTEVPADDLEPEPAQGPVISASGPPPPTNVAESPPPIRPTRAGVYQGGCAAVKAPGTPVQWMDLPADTRATFPLPRAAAAAYASDRAQRFIVIDDAVFREGDFLPNGPQLVSITPSSVVLASSGCVVDVPLRLLQR